MKSVIHMHLLIVDAFICFDTINYKSLVFNTINCYFLLGSLNGDADEDKYKVINLSKKLLELTLSYDPVCPFVGRSVCHYCLQKAGSFTSMLQSEHVLTYKIRLFYAIEHL